MMWLPWCGFARVSLGHILRKPHAVGRDELRNEVTEQRRGAQLAQIDIEVGKHRSEFEHLEFGPCCPVAQPHRRKGSGIVIVPGDVKAAQIGRQIECGEMVGRKGGDHGQGRQDRFQREHCFDAFAGGDLSLATPRRTPLPSR
jgi:hypothetical protein